MKDVLHVLNKYTLTLQTIHLFKKSISLYAVGLMLRNCTGTSQKIRQQK